MDDRLQQLVNICNQIVSHPSLSNLVGVEDSCVNGEVCATLSKKDLPQSYNEKSYWSIYAVRALLARDTDEFASRLETLNWHLKMRTFVSGYTVTVDDVVLFVAFTLSSHWLPIYGSNRRISIKYIYRWYKYLETLDAFKSNKDAFKQDGEYDSAVMMEELDGAVVGKVVTRFPPEPSGYLHIGHAKACLLNSYYAKRYQGKMLLRFDDTNPKKSTIEYRDNILKDLGTLDVTYDAMTYTSDYFALLIEYGEKMIRAGLGYVDTSTAEEMKKSRDLFAPSPCRDDPIEVSLARWEEMKKATTAGLSYCLRAKIDYKSVNGSMRDPVIYRCVVAEHYRTGFQFNVYPTYNFACPIIDALEGVTHALRSNEYHNSEDQFYWFLANIPDMPRRDVKIKDFSRIAFGYTVMSKRKLQWIVDQGIVDTWTDPRFPTIQGVTRRGLTMEALKKFILMQGDSTKGVNMDINILWGINKHIIDHEIPRFTCIRSDNIVPVTISGAPETEAFDTWKCKNNESLGKKTITKANRIYLDQEDAKNLAVNEEVTLMEWGNCIINNIVKEGNIVVSCTATLNLAGDFRTTKKKLTWLPAVECHPLVDVTIVEYDTLITMKDIPKDKEFKDFVNPVSKYTTPALSDTYLSCLKVGDRVQFERLGYFILDAVSDDRKSYTFIQFFDGHDKNPFLSCKVAIRK